MIRYFRATDIADGAWLRYDDATGTASVLNRAELRQRKTFLRSQLDALPKNPSNAELLAWAKANYPALSETEQSRRLIQADLDAVQADLDGIAAVVDVASVPVER